MGLPPIEPQRVVAVVGAPGAGKTGLGLELLKRLAGWRFLAIDAYRAAGRDWPHLMRDVAGLKGPTLVESVLVTRDYEWVLARHDAKMLVVTCDEHVRRQRVAGKPWEHTEPDGRYDWRDLLSVDATEPLDGNELARIARWCAG